MSRDEPKSVVALGAARSTKPLFDRPRADPSAGATGSTSSASGPAAPAAAAGAHRWTVALGGSPVEPFVDATMVVLTSSSGDLTAVALDTGAPRWTAELSGAPGVAPVTDGAVGIAVDRTGTVTAFDVASGRTFWTAALQVPCWSPPAMLGDQVFVGTDGAEFVCLDRATGRGGGFPSARRSGHDWSPLIRSSW